jgi:hypothetical protein
MAAMTSTFLGSAVVCKVQAKVAAKATVAPVASLAGLKKVRSNSRKKNKKTQWNADVDRGGVAYAVLTGRKGGARGEGVAKQDRVHVVLEILAWFACIESFADCTRGRDWFYFYQNNFRFEVIHPLFANLVFSIPLFRPPWSVPPPCSWPPPPSPPPSSSAATPASSASS